VREIIRFSIYH